MIRAPKFMKAFAFRFNGKRNGLLLIFALLGANNSFATTSTLSDCEKTLPKSFEVLMNLRDDKKSDPGKIDKAYVEAHCDKSIESSLNQRWGDEKSQKFDNGVAQDNYNGACQLSYWEMRQLYTKIKDAYHGYCEKVVAAQDVGESCTKKGSIQTPEQCLEELKNKQADASKAFEEIKTQYLDHAANALHPRKDINEKLKKIFNKDAEKFQTELTVSNTPGEYPGSEGFSDIHEYKSFVVTVTPPPNIRGDRHELSKGKLIDEQDLAADNIDKYLEKIEQFKTNGSALSKSLEGYFASIKSKQDKSSAGMDKLGTAAAVAPGLAGAMGSGAKTAASSITPSVSGSAASAALPFAALGVAAISHSGSSTAGSAPSPTLPSGAAQPAAIASTSFGGDRSPAGAGTHVSDALKASEEKKTETTPVVAAISAPFSADGASRAVAIKRVAKNESNDGATKPAESFANTSDAGIIPLGGGRAPSRPSSSPANEVTSLLGQMKSLFNFDEPGNGTGGNPEAAFGGGAPAMGGALAMPGTSGAVAADETGTAAEAQNIAPGVTQEEGTINSEGLGNQTDSLFVRVHKRHVRCQQRGMLLANLGGIR